MSAAAEALRAWAAEIRKLDQLAAEAANEAAPLIQDAARATAELGTTPDGKPWPLKKRGGGRALVHAAQHIAARAVGTAVVLTLTGIDVVHNRGDHRNPRRQIIPDGGAHIPFGIAEAAADGARRAFQRLLGRS